MAKGTEGLRLIAVGEVFIWFINHSIVLQFFKGGLQKYLSPHQFGILTPEGYETIIFGIRVFFNQHPDWVMMQVDVKNIFNNVFGIRVFLNQHLDWVRMQVDVKNVFNNISNSGFGHYTHKVTGQRPFDRNKNPAQ